MYLGNEKIEPELKQTPEDMEAAENMKNIAAEITQRCIEEADRFIFESIEPFCSRVADVLVIEKKQLEEIITKQMTVMPPIDGRCSRCWKEIRNIAATFCENCGQRLREDPDE